MVFPAHFLQAPPTGRRFVRPPVRLTFITCVIPLLETLFTEHRLLRKGAPVFTVIRRNSCLLIDLLYQLRNTPEFRHGCLVLGAECIMLRAFPGVIFRLLPMRRVQIIGSITIR